MDKINGLGDVVKSVTNSLVLYLVMLVKKEEFYLINYFLIKGCSRDTQDEINFQKRIVSNNVIGKEDGNQVFAIYNRVYNKT
jgi:hypothetical protein